MKSKLLFALLSAALVSGVSANAMANNREDAFTISPGIGAYHFDSRRQIENTAALYNLNLGYDFTNNWGVEALIGKMNSHSKSADEPSVSGALYTLDGVYHFNTTSPLEPYLLAGIGVLHLNPNGQISSANPNGDQAYDQANLNAGAGLEYFVHPDIALRGDIHDMYTPNGSRNDYFANFGVSILLGGQVNATDSSMVSVIGNHPANPCLGTKVVVRFANNSAAVDPIYKAELQQVATCMQKQGTLKATVRGYASSTGTIQHNLKLSQHRADNVKAYLVKHDGLGKHRIHAQGFGEAHPMVSNATLAGQAKNRRVETVVVSVFNAS